MKRSEISAKPILFLTFANDRADRARDLRNLAAEARRALASANKCYPSRIDELVEGGARARVRPTFSGSRSAA